MTGHQIHNSMSNVYNAFVYQRAFYAPHFHKGFELIYAIEDGTRAEVNNLSYCLKKGECLLIPPYVSHSLTVKKQNDCLVVVFSARYAESAAKLFQTRKPRDYRFTLPAESEAFIRQNLILEEEKLVDKIALKKPPLLRLKACLYAIFDAFLEAQPLTAPSSDAVLIERLIDCIEQGYTTNLSLDTIAQKLGYSYDYLSRVFHQSFHINFKSILNQYRCEHALHLLGTTQKTLTEISLDSGFQSIRSFNRVFKETIGVPPSEFRRENG